MRDVFLVVDRTKFKWIVFAFVGQGLFGCHQANAMNVKVTLTPTGSRQGACALSHQPYITNN